eukprot:scaffold499_cov335-Pavlova_lutheri.AAC.40
MDVDPPFEPLEPFLPLLTRGDKGQRIRWKGGSLHRDPSHPGGVFNEWVRILYEEVGNGSNNRAQ